MGLAMGFSATSHFTDRVTGEQRRHHLHESVLQRAFKEARLNERKRFIDKLLIQEVNFALVIFGSPIYVISSLNG